MSKQAKADPAEHWWMVVPVKGGTKAKTRLVAPRGTSRRALAQALALDTVTAAASAVGAHRIVVVTGSRTVAEAVAGEGITVELDPGGGLNAAARAGLRLVPVEAAGTAVLLGDLPAARAEDIRAALAAAAGHVRAMVPDHSGRGTVLITARRPAALVPAFGAGSARRHTALGHRPVGLDLHRLRLDVDASADLTAAVALGVGCRTASVLGVTAS